MKSTTDTFPNRPVIFNIDDETTAIKTGGRLTIFQCVDSFVNAESIQAATTCNEKRKPP